MHSVPRSWPVRFLPVLLSLAPAPVVADLDHPLAVAEAASLAAYLDRTASPPETYVLEKFRTWDVVLLGEDHRVRQNLEFVHRLIPLLHQAGVHTLGMEFGASEDQDALDRLVTGEEYDEAEARRLMFRYDVGWAFREYLDVYRTAWELNRSLPAGTRRFRILNLSYRFKWERFNGVGTPHNLAQVFDRGDTESFRADLVKREILDRPGEKLLVLTGTIHAFTRYLHPEPDSLSPTQYRLEDRFMGSRLHRMAPGRVGFLLLHQPFGSKTEGRHTLIQPAAGAIEQVMRLRNGRPVGFDLAGSPFGRLPDDSYFSIGHPDFTLAELADGYVFLAPLSELDGCRIDPEFLTDENWPEAKSRIPGVLDSRLNSPTREAYLRTIREYADVRQHYQSVK